MSFIIAPQASCHREIIHVIHKDTIYPIRLCNRVAEIVRQSKPGIPAHDFPTRRARVIHGLLSDPGILRIPPYSLSCIIRHQISSSRKCHPNMRILNKQPDTGFRGRDIRWHSHADCLICRSQNLVVCSPIRACHTKCAQIQCRNRGICRSKLQIGGIIRPI